MKSKGRPSSSELSPIRKWLFRLIAAALFPLLLLALAEAGLRIAGYGYSTRFFQPLRIHGQEYLVENERFGLRFFPPELARSPAPVRMEAQKPAGVFRIFVLGESAALGDPRPAYGAARYLQALLQLRYPSAKFEVICGAVTAIDSHAILPIARECAHDQGDLWIVYMGNNEMIGPFGATTVFGSQSPPLGYVRFVLAIQQTRVGQWLTAIARQLSGEKQTRSSWGGMKMFLQNRIAPGDKRKEVVYSSFQKNLEDILAASRRTGVPTILSTVAVNLKDCAPFSTLLGTNLSTAAQQACDAAAEAGQLAEGRGDYAEAARRFEQAVAVAPLSADLHFKCGSEFLASTNLPQALSHFEMARDFDALPFRADSQINSIIRATGAKRAGPGLAFVDVAGLIASNSPSGIPGKEYLYEHVHLNFDGNYKVARAWAEQTERWLPEAVTQNAGAHWATQEECERRLGLTDWNRVSVLEDMLGRLSQPPFTGQANHSKQMEELRARVHELRDHLKAEAGGPAKDIYIEALKAAPDDHRLHENFAEFLEMVADLPGALAQWKHVSELIPQHHLAFFQAGRLLRRMGQLDEAITWLGKAVRLRPDLSEGWLELGNAHSLQGKSEAALGDYSKARELTPQDHRIYYHAGKALSKLRRGPEAILNFQQALTLYPGDWEARYALGEELAFGGQPAEARRQFEQVIQQRPQYALAHLNLGVALVKLGDREGALREFQETLRLDPQNQMVAGYIEKLRWMTEQK